MSQVGFKQRHLLDAYNLVMVLLSGDHPEVATYCLTTDPEETVQALYSLGVTPGCARREHLEGTSFFKVWIDPQGS
jgi:hypothetical protein